MRMGESTHAATRVPDDRSATRRSDHGDLMTTASDPQDGAVRRVLVGLGWRRRVPIARDSLSRCPSLRIIPRSSSFASSRESPFKVKGVLFHGTIAFFEHNHPRRLRRARRGGGRSGSEGLPPAELPRRRHLRRDARARAHRARGARDATRSRALSRQAHALASGARHRGRVPHAAQARVAGDGDRAPPEGDHADVQLREARRRAGRAEPSPLRSAAAFRPRSRSGSSTASRSTPRRRSSRRARSDRSSSASHRSPSHPSPAFR